MRLTRDDERGEDVVLRLLDHGPQRVEPREDLRGARRVWLEGHAATLVRPSPPLPSPSTPLHPAASAETVARATVCALEAGGCGVVEPDAPA